MGSLTSRMFARHFLGRIAGFRFPGVRHLTGTTHAGVNAEHGKYPDIQNNPACDNTGKQQEIRH